jgi:LmbE family N-acetylglucosaminyl deacetylase
MTWSRRNLFRWAGRGGFALPLLARAQQTTRKEGLPADSLPGAGLNRKLKVIFVGAHVDDWIDCAGAIARYVKAGHQALLLSFTPGDSRSMADMNRLALDELAKIRRQDALEGAKILGAEIRFLDQHNQNMQVSPEVYDKFNKLLMDEKPDVVFGMWPLEFHPDHRAVASISFNAWLQCGLKFEYFFCETASGGEMQTQQFIPNRYIDVESVMELKRSSHEANRFIKQGAADAELWARFRGMQYGCRYAEAFVQIQTVAKMPAENLAPRRWYYGGLRMHSDY